MIIREATIHDLEALTELFDAYRIFYQKESDLSGAKSFLTDRISNKDSRLYVSQYNTGVLIGFVQLYPLFSSTKMKRMWLLNDLFVHPEYRGQDVSKLLIHRAKQLAKDTDATSILLETEKSNLIGNKLYPKTGFQLNQDSNFYEWNT